MQLCATAFLSMSAATTSGLPEITGGRGRVSVHIDKAAMKGDGSRPEIQARMNDRAEARRLGIPLGEMRTRLLVDALQRCIGVITAAKAYQWFRFMQTLT